MKELNRPVNEHKCEAALTGKIEDIMKLSRCHSIMDKLINNNSQLKLVIATTPLCITATLLILTIGYNLTGVEIRGIEIAFSITAPLLIASMVSWFLYGLIKKLDYTEKQLRHQMVHDKEEVYLATINGAQHVLNNLMNGFILINLEIDNYPLFNQKN